MSLRPLFVLLLCCVASPALAASLAILPLDKGPSAPDYDGLGYVLAGMLTTDLSHVQALTLVERQRLDAVLSEMELGQTAFIDPATAAKMGKGLGAEWVLVGSWTVVKDSLALNARVVDVAGGSVLAAADTQGPVTDYVTVEKDLVEALLADLPLTVSSGERRKYFAESPTESFEALKTYSDGVAAQRRGELERAQQAFTAALQADPEYAAARAAIDALKASLEAEAARRKQTEETAEQRAWRYIEEHTVDPRSLPKDFRWDSHEQGRLALRWYALTRQARFCQLYEEQWAYGEGRDWSIDYDDPPRRERRLENRFGVRVDARKAMLDLAVEAGHIEAYEDDLSVRSNDAFLYWIGTTVDARTYALNRAIYRGVWGSIERCLSPEQAVEKYTELVAHFADDPFMKELYDRESPGFLIEHVVFFELVEAEIWRDGGLSPNRVADMEALRDSLEGDGRRAADHFMKGIARHAEEAARLHSLRTRRSEAELERIGAGLMAEDPEVLDRSRPVCAAHYDRSRKWGGFNDLERRYEDFSKRDREIDRWRRRWDVVALDQALLVPIYLGCVKGISPRIPDAAAARAWHAEQAARIAPVPPDKERCDGQKSSVEAWTQDYHWAGDQWLVSAPNVVRSMSSAWQSGCWIPPETY